MYLPSARELWQSNTLSPHFWCLSYWRIKSQHAFFFFVKFCHNVLVKVNTQLLIYYYPPSCKCSVQKTCQHCLTFQKKLNFSFLNQHAIWLKINFKVNISKPTNNSVVTKVAPQIWTIFRGVRVPLFSWFPLFWTNFCAKISAFSSFFSAYFWHFTLISRCFSSFFACGLSHLCIL